MKNTENTATKVPTSNDDSKGWRLTYYALACACAASVLVSYYRQIFIGDFWDYAAMIRAIQLTPFHNGELFVHGETTLTPYWPFLAISALIGKILGLDAIESMVLAGVFNSFLLCFAFKYFLAGNFKLTVFSIACVVGLWGNAPWMQSNFFHAEVLPFVLPYPATFAFAVSLICLKWLESYLNNPTRAGLLLVFAGCCVVILTHPIVSLFLLAAIIAWTIELRPSSLLTSISLELGVILVALVWPLFPLIEGLSGTGHLNATGARMYTDVLGRLYPTLLIGIPSLLLLSSQKLLHRYVLLFLLLGGVYAAGWGLHMGSFGRVISFIAIVLQLTIAAQLYRLSELPQLNSKITANLASISIISILALTVLNASDLLLRFPPSPCFELQKIFSLSKGVVLSNERLTQCLPPLGARSVAVIPSSCPFIPKSCEKRLEAQRSFFNCASSKGLRDDILKEYSVTKVLLDCQTDSCLCTQKDSFTVVSRLRSAQFLLSATENNKEP